eukprot:12802033-Alexandrium_andersonii.AAC.1
MCIRDSTCDTCGVAWRSACFQRRVPIGAAHWTRGSIPHRSREAASSVQLVNAWVLRQRRRGQAL